VPARPLGTAVGGVDAEEPPQGLGDRREGGAPGRIAAGGEQRDPSPSRRAELGEKPRPAEAGRPQDHGLPRAPRGRARRPRRGDSCRRAGARGARLRHRRRLPRARRDRRGDASARRRRDRSRSGCAAMRQPGWRAGARRGPGRLSVSALQRPRFRALHDRGPRPLRSMPRPRSRPSSSRCSPAPDRGARPRRARLRARRGSARAFPVGRRADRGRLIRPVWCTPTTRNHASRYDDASASAYSFQREPSWALIQRSVARGCAPASR